ncbi:sensor histidine kinase [Paenibacillus senegalensis]|uniref:sensor histidine kinase n=1 Tax=Paenibacillus senegalensis TaxID=1465766 RepID=UPI000288C8CB|nr:ATP-binding protein [Paenibacillus senegalensis]
MRLSNKIHLYSSVMFVLLLVLVLLFIYMLFSRQTLNSELDKIKLTTENIAANVTRSADMISPKDLLRAYVPVNGMIRIVDQEARSLFVVTSPSEAELSQSPVTRYPEQSSLVVSYKGHKYALASIPLIWVDGQVVNLQVTESLQTMESNLKLLRNVLILVTLLAAVPVFLSGRLLSNLISRPISSMIGTMREIRASGRFKRLELPKRSKDELYEMGKTFNQMIELLETHFEKQEQFVANASHELKTPLTVIESYASLLKRRGLEQPDLFVESVDAIHSEAVRMRELTQQLLLLAKHDEQWNLHKEELDLKKLVSSSAKAFQNAYGRVIEIIAPQAVSGYSDEKKLKQLIFIFLDNARKYSEDKIVLYVGRTTNGAYIRIEDRGIGIPKNELEKVFDRFYRVDKSRSRKDGSAGLGLSLAKEIAEAIGARLELDSLEGAGTTATLILPDK